MTRRKDVRLRIKHNAMRRLWKRPDNHAAFLLRMANFAVFQAEVARRIAALNSAKRQERIWACTVVLT